MLMSFLETFGVSKDYIFGSDTKRAIVFDIK